MSAMERPLINVGDFESESDLGEDSNNSNRDCEGFSVSEDAVSNVFEYDSIIFPLTWLRISPHHTSITRKLQSLLGWPDMGLNGSPGRSVAIDVCILILILILATFCIVIPIIFLAPRRLKPWTIVEIFGYIGVSLPLYAMALTMFSDLHGYRSYLARVFELIPGSFDKAEFRAKIALVISIVCTLVTAVLAGVASWRYMVRNDINYMQTHSVKAFCAIVMSSIGGFLAGTIGFCCFTSFCALIHTLHRSFELLAKDMESEKLSLGRVRHFMKQHGALLILIQRYGKWDKYLISLGVTLGVAAAATLGCFVAFILTANLGFLLWPSLLLPAALIILFHLAWLSGASNNLRKDMLRVIALDQTRHSLNSTDYNKDDPSVHILLFTYLQSAIDIYWSIGVDITPTLVGTLCSVLLTAASTVIPLVLKTATQGTSPATPSP